MSSCHILSSSSECKPAGGFVKSVMKIRGTKTRAEFQNYMCENKLLKKYPTQYGIRGMKTHVFCNITSCRLINIFTSIRILNSSDSEDGDSEDMLVHTHQSTRPNILKHFRLHYHIRTPIFAIPH